MFCKGLTFLCLLSYVKVKVTWHTAKYGDPYSEFVLCIYPSKVHTHTPWTHTHTHTHTPWTHTHREHTDGAVGSHLCSWGFGALLKATSVVVLNVERVLYIHSPHLQFLPARDSNPQPLGYESDSLPLGHDLNCNVNSFEAVLWYHGYTIVHKRYNNKSTPINRN